MDRTGLTGYLMATAYNLIRMAMLLTELEAMPVPLGWPAAGSARPKKGVKGASGAHKARAKRP